MLGRRRKRGIGVGRANNRYRAIQLDIIFLASLRNGSSAGSGGTEPPVIVWRFDEDNAKFDSTTITMDGNKGV